MISVGVTSLYQIVTDFEKESFFVLSPLKILHDSILKVDRIYFWLVFAIADCSTYVFSATALRNYKAFRVWILFQFKSHKLILCSVSLSYLHQCKWDVIQSCTVSKEIVFLYLRHFVKLSANRVPGLQSKQEMSIFWSEQMNFPKFVAKINPQNKWFMHLLSKMGYSNNCLVIEEVWAMILLIMKLPKEPDA